MIIKPIQKQHLPQLLSLLQQLFPFSTTVEEAEYNLTLMLSHKEYYLLGAFEGEELLGSVLGTVITGLVSPFLVIEDVIVKEGHRSMGIGHQLMTALDEIAKETNCEYAILVSTASRIKAHQFYEKEGFIDDVRGFRKVYYTLD